ncbi:hypothetical protein ATCVBr0604L_126L [Acanthocystis turfacea Chlorella virus Br0604L]|nr:hypothetical protein ATCVBr0604L_126L [Acanthocystis turfacea Chlorella virus Br0604L]
MILNYYSSDSTLTTFDNYTIDEHGVITNIEKNTKVTRHEKQGYNRVAVISNDGTPRTIRVARAIASTFLGKPPTDEHTADHIDRNRLNDTLKNIQWASKSEQINNRTIPREYKAAFVIIHNNIGKTANEWVESLKNDVNPYGNMYTKGIILKYARQQKHGFMYKVFEDLPGEEWRVIKGSKSSQGVMYISSEGRIKYKTKYAENVLTSEQLTRMSGYPVVGFDKNGIVMLLLS